MYTLRITPAIANEWQSRCIGDVIPQLADQWIEPGRLAVDHATLQAVVADCRFMADPKAIDCSPAERRAYRTFLAQCERVLAIGPVEQ